MSFHYEIITVGTELTLGLTPDRNAHKIARALSAAGLICGRHTAVPDTIEDIERALSRALADFPAAIMTGGLGPTVDDLTREAICAALGRRLIFDAGIAAMIRRRFEKPERALPQKAYRQAYLPEGAHPITPVQGSAPGIILEQGDRTIVALPGVPAEMAAMLESDVVPYLVRRFAGRTEVAGGESHAVIVTRTLKTSVTSEAVLEEVIGDLLAAATNPSVGIFAHPGEIHLQLTARAPSIDEARRIVASAERRFRRRLGHLIFGADEQTLEAVTGRLLKRLRLTVAVGESCTGGVLAKRLTDVPGSSAFFRGSVVAYGDDVKRDVLGVSAHTMRRYGSVSAPCAIAMAFGARRRLSGDIALGVTGIAGPGGGGPEKPVGLVFIAVSAPGSNFCQRYHFFGSRPIVREKAAQAALNVLRQFLLDAASGVAETGVSERRTGTAGGGSAGKTSRAAGRGVPRAGAVAAVERLGGQESSR